MLKNISTSASSEEKQALAQSLIESGLDQKGQDLKERQSQSFRFEKGDVVTIEAGFAQPIVTTIGESEVKYLGFPVSVKHPNGVVEQTTVSLRQLTSPTILLSEKPTCKRSDLAYRFGRQIVAFEDVTIDGKTITLAKLASRVTLTITTGTVWMPDYDTYDTVSRTYSVLAEPRENYGYVEA